MKKSKIPAWLFMKGDSARCDRCGETETPGLPMPINAFCKWVEYFGEKHRYCEPKSAPEEMAS